MPSDETSAITRLIILISLSSSRADLARSNLAETPVAVLTDTYQEQKGWDSECVSNGKMSGTLDKVRQILGNIIFDDKKWSDILSRVLKWDVRDPDSLLIYIGVIV